MAFGGAALRFGQTGIRTLQLLSAILILAIFSYFLAVLANHHLAKPQYVKAIEGISGAGVLYGIFCVLLTLFLGGVSFFAFLAVVIDVCFIGCYVAITILTRHGAGSCSGFVRTPLGDGQANTRGSGTGNSVWVPNLHRACKLETAVFAVAVLNIFLFIISAIVQVLLAKHHRKEKKFGPGPSNNYTSGSGKTPFWKRNRGTGGGMFGTKKSAHSTRDAELATSHAGMPVRPSHDTGFTGNTLHGTNGAMDDAKYGQPGYGQTTGTTTHY